MVDIYILKLCVIGFRRQTIYHVNVWINPNQNTRMLFPLIGHLKPIAALGIFSCTWFSAFILVRFLHEPNRIRIELARIELYLNIVLNWLSAVA